MTTKKKVCIIGAGISGLVSIKCCLDAGLFPICYEQDPFAGGLWNKQNSKTVPNCTVTNTSKEQSCFSDFPFPDEFPNFMAPEKIMDYFSSYAEKFDLLKYIVFNCEVTQIDCCTGHKHGCLCAECAENYGKYWTVSTQEAGKTENCDHFDFLIVSAGFNRTSYVPENVNEIMKNFTGRITHSSDYRDWKNFEDDRVVVCGFGNSAGDISSELSRHTSKLYLATKHGSYTLSRIAPGGYPYDAKYLRKVSDSISVICPMKLKNIFLSNLCNSVVDHSNFGLAPMSTGTDSHIIAPVINDEITTRISTGHIIVKEEISSIKGQNVTFQDGSVAQDINSIVLCTGYKRHFSFLERKNIFSFGNDGKIFPLYKNILPCEHKGKVAFVGATAVKGSVFPIYEMQARYAVEVFLGNVNLPSEREMMLGVDETSRRTRALFGFELREQMRVPYIAYQDELAADIGAKPNLFKLFFSDPLLVYHVFFGPSCPYQYRLTGPSPWSGARDAILTVNKRIWHPFRSQEKYHRKENLSTQTLVLLLLAAFFMFIIFRSFS